VLSITKETIYGGIDVLNSIPSTVASVKKAIDDLPSALETAKANLTSTIQSTQATIQNVVDFPNKIKSSLTQRPSVEISEVKSSASATIVQVPEISVRPKQTRPLRTIASEYEIAKENLYSKLDEVVLNYQNAENSIKKQIQTIREIPTTAAAFKRRTIENIEAVKTSFETSVEAVNDFIIAVKRLPNTAEETKIKLVNNLDELKLQLDLRREDASKFGAKLWRIVTLEEAKIFVAETKESIDRFTISAKEFNNKIRTDPLSLVFKKKSVVVSENKINKTKKPNFSPTLFVENVKTNYENVKQVGVKVVEVSKSTARIGAKAAGFVVASFSFIANKITESKKENEINSVKVLSVNIQNEIITAKVSPGNIQSEINDLTINSDILSVEGVAIAKSEAEDKLFGFVSKESFDVADDAIAVEASPVKEA